MLIDRVEGMVGATSTLLVKLYTQLVTYQSDGCVSEQSEGMLSLILICITFGIVFRETKTEND